jgi:hypothetical protein
VRWLERLPVSGAARSRVLFTTHSEFSDLTPTQYDAAYAWLHQTGLLDDVHSKVPAQRRIFDCAMVHSGASWFPDADMLVRGPDELPDDALRAADALGLRDSEAYAQLSAVWGKVDTAERSRIGLAGERALIELLTASTTARVEHVAAWSDGYGYDIAVHAHGYAIHLEAKTTTRRGRLTVFISRNEYETMLRDPSWQMVTMRLSPDLAPAAIASVPRDWIATQIPADPGSSGRWESCRLSVPPDVPERGIPGLAPVLMSDASALLTGAVGWPG